MVRDWVTHRAYMIIKSIRTLSQLLKNMKPNKTKIHCHYIININCKSQEEYVLKNMKPNKTKIDLSLYNKC
jgi:hypothetical protein